MRVGHRVRSRRAAWVPFSALLAAGAMVLAIVAPVSAAQPILFDPVVNPRSGPPDTTIQLHVMYGYDSNDGPHGPEYVRGEDRRSDGPDAQ